MVYTISIVGRQSLADNILDKSYLIKLDYTYIWLIIISVYDVNWHRRALRRLRRIEHSQRQEIVDAVGSLENWPRCRNVKALTHHRYGYRLRVGRYRVFFDVDKAVKIMRIEEVRKRDKRTY